MRQMSAGSQRAGDKLTPILDKEALLRWYSRADFVVIQDRIRNNTIELCHVFVYHRALLLFF